MTAKNRLEELIKAHRVDAAKLWSVVEPRPEERAVLRLAIVYNETGPKKSSVSAQLVADAAAFFNAAQEAQPGNGLTATLNEIQRLGKL
mgnify:CR=1 FL=1